jgi:hypothetical protein
MKMTTIGVKRVKGDKSKAGNPFDILSVFVLVPVEQVTNDKVQITGAGSEMAEVPLDEAALQRFLDLKYPVVLDLQMDSRPRFGKFESVCVGYVVVPQTKAA